MKLPFLPFLLLSVVQAQELVVRYRADFSQGKANTSLQRNWILADGNWQIRDGVLAASAPKDSSAIPRMAPEAKKQILEADVTIRKRLAKSGWAVAALRLQKDKANYWQLALCEAQDGQRYSELGESYEGIWKANTGKYPLAPLPGKKQLAWKYDHTYRLRLELQNGKIIGRILDSNNEVLAMEGYTLQTGKSLANGQLALRISGLEADIDNVSVRARPRPTPESLGIDFIDGKKGRIALLADSLPGTSQRLTETYVQALTKQGFGVTLLNSSQLEQPGVLVKENFQILALIPANLYPATAGDNIRRFLKRGGHLLTVGGRPFSTPCTKGKDGWLSQADALEILHKTQSKELLFDFNTEQQAKNWKRSSNMLGKSKSEISLQKQEKESCLQIDIRGFSQWDTFQQQVANPFPTGHELTCLRLRGTPQSAEIAVEWKEKDGSRWIATAKVGTDWTSVALQPEDFAFWKNGSPPNRGAQGDHFRPENADILVLGVATSHTRIPSGDHRFQIAEIGTAPYPIPRESLGKQDSLELPLFSTAYEWEQLDNCSQLVTEEFLGEKTSFAATLSGSAVMGFPKPGLSEFRPLLMALDSKQRRQSPAAGLLIHHNDIFRGGRWAIFTPEGAELPQRPEFIAAVTIAAKRLLAPLCISKSTLPSLDYAPGTSSSAELEISHLGETSLQATLQIEISGGPIRHQKILPSFAIAPGEKINRKITWQVPDSPGDYRLHFRLLAGNQLNDFVSKAFTAGKPPKPESACRGPIRLGKDGKHLTYPDGKRFFCIGANYTGSLEEHGRFLGDQYFNPRKLEAHFAAARDAGINVWRSCGWCWNASGSREILAGDFRKIDLYMDLAARYGVYQYITPPGNQEFNLGKRIAVYTALAKHLRGHPALFGYDLQNEPEIIRMTGLKYPPGILCPTQEFDFLSAYPERLEPKRETLWKAAKARRLGRNLLSRELSDKQAFNVVCATNLYHQWRREYGISFSTFPEMEKAWPPSNAWKPLIDKIDAGIAAYVNTQIDAIRTVDPDALVSVGYNQCLSIFPANKRLDFVSQHVYQRPYTYEDVRKNITTLDRLKKIWPDKPITLGEFGYTSGIEMPDGNYLSIHAGAVGEMIHWLYAIDRGYDGCKKWVLNDFPLSYMHHFGGWSGRGLRTQTYEERFGIYAWDGSPRGRRKPIGIALAALRRYIDRAGPTGKLTISKGSKNTKAFYRFAGDRALFIGADHYQADGLRFQSQIPVNLILDWGGGNLALTATADIDLRIDGKRYKLQATQGTKSITLLAGETIVLKTK